MTSSHWFFDWMDKNSVRSFQDFERITDDNRVLDALEERATTQSEVEGLSSKSRSTLTGDILVAGSDLDLSGELSCMNPDCRVAQIQHLFRRAWLYFDRIVIADTLTPYLMHGRGREDWLFQVATSARILIHLQEIGAEHLVEFQRKLDSANCSACTDDMLKQKGLEDLVARYEIFVTDFLPEALVSIEDIHGHREICLTHPLIDGAYTVDSEQAEDLASLFTFEQNEIKARNHNATLEELVCRRYVRTVLQHLAVDVSSAAEWRAPLGTTDPLYKKMIAAKSTVTSGDVGFELQLPVLSALPVETLIEIRNDEAEYFGRFRDSLRKAINERLRAETAADPQRIARDIREDLIEPELRRIRARLKKADDSLMRKTGMAMGVGTLITTCGLATGLLPATILGAATIAGGLVVPYQQDVDKRADIELSDMFFLWRAIQHAEELR